MEKDQLSAKDNIFRYLRQNRGREIPVSELKSKLELKPTTISNAIKELHLQGLIDIERRPLKRGRYTVIYLTGDLIKEPYVHKNEILVGKKKLKIIKKEEKPAVSEFDSFEEWISYLKSPNYNAEELFIRIESIFPDSISFVTDFITPLMHKVGILWVHNNLSTAEEHIISNRIEQLIFTKISTNRAEKDRGSIILVPVEGERHIISLLSLEYIFCNLNYKVINLGLGLPIESLIQYIKDLPELPDWIFISITLSTYVGTLKRSLECLYTNFKDQFHIAIGGQGISENERNMFPEADVIASNREDLLRFIELFR